MTNNIRPKRYGNIYGRDKGTGYAGNVWDVNYLSPTIDTCQGGQRMPLIMEISKSNTIIYDDYNSNIPYEQNIIGTLTTNCGSGTFRTGLKLIEVESEDVLADTSF